MPAGDQCTIRFANAAILATGQSAIRPCRKAAANASPAPTGSATRIACPPASMYSSPYSIAHPRAPRVTHTAFQPNQFRSFAAERLDFRWQPRKLAYNAEFFFVELDYVGQVQHLDHKLHRIIAGAEVEVVEANRGGQSIQEPIEQRPALRHGCKQSSIVEGHRVAIRMICVICSSRRRSASYAAGRSMTKRVRSPGPSSTRAVPVGYRREVCKKEVSRPRPAISCSAAFPRQSAPTALISSGIVS